MALKTLKVTLTTSEQQINFSGSSKAFLLFEIPSSDTTLYSYESGGTANNNHVSLSGKTIPIIISQSEMKQGFNLYAKGTSGGAVYFQINSSSDVTITVT